MTQLKRDIKDLWIVVVGIIAYITITDIIFGYCCPVRIIFHHECPGCGLTRAFLSFFKGDISAALHYNYTFVFWLISFILLIIHRYIKKLFFNPFPILFIISAIASIIRYLLIVMFKMPIF
ncbi:MAG: DUF2752 domain-containing protein [Bacilli bacterium]|nr:DUF2752 domain-containing protein [Bacilli bacterium]